MCCEIDRSRSVYSCVWVNRGHGFHFNRYNINLILGLTPLSTIFRLYSFSDGIVMSGLTEVMLDTAI